MRRKRRKRNDLNVSLFPFLAVLICTLGVLIVMLVMAAKSADVEAKTAQSADDKTKQETIDELQFALDLRLTKIEGMRDMRPDAQQRLSDARTNRSHLEDDIRELKKEFRYVQEDLIALRAEELAMPEEADDFSRADADQEIAKLLKLVEQKKNDVAEKRELASRVGPSAYKIVPYNGNRGTFRKPIFIECTKDAIILQPSGIRLSKGEFAPPLAPGNTIDSALLATREYWERYDLAGEDGSPYPLIVVRPDGAETFVIARRAMKSWDDEFGYELVNSDQVLDFGPRDPQLEREVNEAIRDARNRTQALVMNRKRARKLGSGAGTGFGVGPASRASRFETPESRPGLTVSSQRGGFVSSQNEVIESASALAGYDQAANDFHVSQAANNQFSSQQVGQNKSRDSSNSATQSQNQTKKSGGQSGEGKMQNPYADLSVAKERGKDWALPARTPGGTGYMRPIRIVCSTGYLEVQTPTGPHRIPFSGATAGAIDPLVNEVWKQIDSWGISGANGYWKPQLRFTVANGAEQRFLELKGLLHQSGLGIAGTK